MGKLGRETVHYSAIKFLLLAVFLASPSSFSHDNIPHSIKGTSKADSAEQCVEPTEIMQKEHFVFLYHQRDKTVINGVRTKNHSFANCIDCHVSYDNKGTPIPINSEGQFCQTCHVQTAVNIDCFSCHASVPRGRKAMTKAFLKNHPADVISNKANEILEFVEAKGND